MSVESKSDDSRKAENPLLRINSKKKHISEHVKALINKRQRPRNQIAAISGLTNTYIKDLEEGNITNVRRDKLLALSVALDLRLKDIDKLLAVFDRQHLSKEDIPIFIEYSKHSKITTAMIPLNSAVPYGPLLSIENTRGPYVIVNPEPTYILIKDGYGRFARMNRFSNHPLFEDFIDAILHERYRLMIANLKEFPITQYLCLDCLYQYLHRYNDDSEQALRQNHIRNVIALLSEEDNFHLRLLNICPSSSFSLKLSSQVNQTADKLIMIFWPQHRLNWVRSGKLTGFTTSHQAVVQPYKDELALIKKSVIDGYRNREKLIRFLNQLTQE